MPSVVRYKPYARHRAFEVGHGTETTLFFLPRMEAKYAAFPQMAVFPNSSSAALKSNEQCGGRGSFLTENTFYTSRWATKIQMLRVFMWDRSVPRNGVSCFRMTLM